MRSCSRGLVFVRCTNTALPKLSESGDRSTIFFHGDQRANDGVQCYQCQSKDRQAHHLPAKENCTGSDAAIYSDGPAF